MRELKKILVATDLQEAGDSCAATAVLLAQAFDSRILLLHVMPDILSDPWADEVSPESVAALLEEWKLRIESGGPSVEDIAVLRGKASYLICQHAEYKDVDLIVLGASQRRTSDVRLGVTAGRVLRNSVKPVWLAAQTDAAPPTAILCPVDGSWASRRALGNAIRLARRFDARLTVLRVREAMPEVYARMMRPDDPTPSREMRKLRASLNALVGEYDIDGINLDTQVREGVAHAEILSAVAELTCDLVVMGTEGMSNPPRALVGSVTEKVTRAMPCSIVVVSEEDVLAARLRAAMASIQRHMQEGESLLRAGNPLESLAEYEQCLLEEPTYAPAWEGIAAAYKALGDLNKADRCKEWAQQIRQTIW
ncbi:MAG: universal stress protein [Gemmatimonadota bacterium]|nr:MAG: universal stress protein [Gemmatimonadota bacterium]